MPSLRATLLVPTLLLSLSAFAADAAREETREVADFDGVEVGHGMRAEVTVGPKSVRVSGDARQLPMVRTEVVRGKLLVKAEGDSWHDSLKGVRLTISTPKLTHVQASGGARVSAEATAADSFTADASGGSELSVRGVDAKRLKVDVSGGSKANLQGRGGALELDVSGGSRFHGGELILQSLSVDASGGAKVEANPTERLDGELSGGSTLYLESSPPQRNVSTSGGSQVLLGK